MKSINEKSKQIKGFVEPLRQEDWNFGDVPNQELIACCYWEYARESAFIRDTLRCYREWWAEGGKRNKASDELFARTDRIQSGGSGAGMLLHGCAFKAGIVWQSTDREREDYRHPDAPPITGSFPNAWQTLTAEERAYRSHIDSDVERLPLVPFERGHVVDAKDIVQSVEVQRRQIDAANDQVRRANPTLTEEALCRAGKLRFPTIQPSIYHVGGKEFTVIGIEWGSFTDDEITTYFRRWVKANRPANVPAPNAQGRKLRDWRVALNRLGTMRALHAYSFADHRFPKALKERGEKHCYAARKLVLKKFNELFPFLPRGEKPINWVTKGRRSSSQ